jgi:hypothetical protein
MVHAIKKQLKDYQSWVNIATQSQNNLANSISRYDLVTFLYVFSTFLFLTFLVYRININFTLAAIILHVFLGLNMLKARKVIADALDTLNNHKNIKPNVAKFLNKEYSLFLVTQGKLPLTEDQIENLEVHKKVFVRNQMTRAGRGDSIRRFRLAFLKREKSFFDILIASLIIVEFFVIF